MAIDKKIKEKDERKRAVEFAATITTAYASSGTTHNLVNFFEIIYDSILKRIRGEAQASST